MTHLNLLAGWIGIFAGVVSGGAIGLQFHKENWLGGYSSFRRRLLRLAHISFVGLGVVNILYAISVQGQARSAVFTELSSGALVLGLATMPLCCYLTAWKASFRYAFSVPVSLVLMGIGSILAGWSPT